MPPAETSGSSIIHERRRAALFARATLDPDAPVPAGLRAHHGREPVRRFAIYRNNVVASLIAALRAQFIAVERLVGVDYFKALARAYISAEPPRSPLMFEYGDSFPGFIAAFPPLRHLPFLADVARLDRAQVRAYHAADAEPLTAELLSDLPEEALEGLHVACHPSLFLLRSPWRAFDIWHANRLETSAQGFDPRGAQDAIVVRPALEVQTWPVKPATALLLERLARPLALSALFAELETAGIAGEVAGHALGEALARGALVAVAPPGPSQLRTV